MAIITVVISKGRPQSVKDEIIAKLTSVMIETINAEPRQVRVVINEVEEGCYGVAGKAIIPLGSS